MSTINVVDSIGRVHSFKDAAAVELEDDGSILIKEADEPRRSMGAFAGGHWSSWRREADDASAPVHKTHVHVARGVVVCGSADRLDLAEIMDRGAGPKSGPPSGL